MKRATQAVAAFSLLLTTGVLFQNCGAYQPPQNSMANLASEEPCIDQTCDNRQEALQLDIGNSDPLFVVKAMPTIDVAGYCDKLDYSGSVVQFKIVELGGDFFNAGSCDAMGRFQISVPNPALNVGGSFTLQVRMLAIDGATYVDNPLALNLKQRTLTIY